MNGFNQGGEAVVCSICGKKISYYQSYEVVSGQRVHVKCDEKENKNGTHSN